jgi:formate/nitrite transporter
MVILTGGELFTGNVFFMMAGMLSGKVSPRQLAANWSVSFLGNFAGSLFVAALAFLAGTTAVQPWLGTTLAVATFKSSLPFAVAFTRGVLCNWMVCTAVWIATAAQSPAGKLLGIWMLVSSFVAMGFEHSIANMMLIPLGILNGAPVAFSTFLTSNLLPVTLGNIVGGGLLIGAAYWYAYGENA